MTGQPHSHCQRTRDSHQDSQRQFITNEMPVEISCGILEAIPFGICGRNLGEKARSAAESASQLSHWCRFGAAGQAVHREARGMTMPSSPAGSPTVGRRRLAVELREIREGSSQKLETVATALNWSTSRLSRYELAKGGMRPRDVDRLLDHYQITGPRRDQLLALAEEAAQKGWWEDFSDVSSAEFLQFIGLEAEATSIAIWHSEVVTGLLQTQRYARAIMRDYYTQVEPTAPAILERRLQLRMRRQRVLSRDPPLKLLVVLDESILRRRIGDESVMYEQLSHLAEMDEKTVTLRVLPLAGRHPVIVDSFVVFRFGEQDAILHDVVATESIQTEFYVEGQQETHFHRIVFDMLLNVSLDQDQSKELILNTAESVWRDQ